MGRRRFRKVSKEPQQAMVHGLSHEGRGVANIEGKTTFIRGALPDEEVVFTYTQQRGQFDEGEVQEVCVPAANRIQPKCAVFGRCGGCNMQHLNGTDQLAHKQTVLAELMQKEGVAPAEWLPPLASSAWGYRRKARLGVRHVPKKGGVLVGFRETNGRFLTDMHRCEVLHDSVGERIDVLREFLVTLEGCDQIPQLEVAVDDDHTAIIMRHLQPLCEGDLSRIMAFAEAEQLHWYLQPKGPQTIHRIWPNAESEPMHYRLPKHQVDIAFQPQDFTQVNAELNQEMVDLALALLELKSTDRVLDLFCGLGNFTLPMARYAGEVIGIEGDAPMVERAAKNADNNSITNVEFHAANLFEALGKPEWMQLQYDKLLLDPPRAGAKEILEQLADVPFERIVYVSCNPATLARDAAILVSQGYQLVSAGVMDMFPQTAHVESIACFVRDVA